MPTFGDGLINSTIDARNGLSFRIRGWGPRLHDELTARRVIVDRRDPDILRLGMSPLTTRFTDVFDGVAALAAS